MPGEERGDVHRGARNCIKVPGTPVVISRRVIFSVWRPALNTASEQEDNCAINDLTEENLFFGNFVCSLLKYLSVITNKTNVNKAWELSRVYITYTTVIMHVFSCERSRYYSIIIVQ